ncbi:MAG: DNA internalization-related competence protein ComEC/Rec2, partial [Ectothiorhodospiraceae bacterium]|nr:DNA internalization-related competence protein ComEC/Rec2 [Ectothiorhodospiraceae bacterium]
HLMAISGLHVGLVAGLAGLLALRLWRLSARLCLWLAAPRAAALAGLAAGFVYALLAGFAIPTQRALVMLTVVAAALAWGRIGTPSRTLALALLAVLLLDPLSVLSPGFWLSFAAVAVILYALTGRRAGHPLAWLRIQVVIAIGLLPLTVWFFQFGAVVSPLANLIAVPWVGFVVVPSTLLGAALAPWMPAVAGLPLWLADAALDLLWPVLEWLAALPGGQWLPPAPPFVWLLLALAGGALLLAPRGWPARWLGAVLLLPMLTWQPPAPAEGDFRFTLLEVGQGLAAVIETRRHLLVYDTGPRFSDRFDAGEAAIHPYLVHRGRRRVDRLILSHGDDDHAGGAASLLARVPVGEVLGDTGDRDDLPSPRPCKAGEAWRWDGVDFELLHPPRGWRGDNEASCVLRVAAAGGSLLLTGDIERLAEAAMLRERREALAAEVMLIPHHGALTSSTPAFIDAVRPRLAVVSSGYGNRFGHPRPEILALYRERDIPVLDTAREGAITLRFEVDGLAIEPGYRHAVRRYWHRP